MKNLIFCVLFVLTALELVSQDRPKTTDDYYRIITLPVPQDIELEVGGLAALPNGDLAVATRRGDVWFIANAYGKGNKKPTFRRFAHGLHEPLGLLYRENDFLVTQRGEVTRLVDNNRDGVADSYESLAKWPLSGNYHQYSYGPVRMPNGDMLVTLNVDWVGKGGSLSKWRGWMLKLDNQGNLTPWAAGLRSPAGFGSFRGDIFYSENQGDWVASGRIAHLERGDFAGHPAGLRWSNDPASPIKLQPEEVPNSGEPMHNVARTISQMKLPAVWFPHTLLGISLSDLKEDTTRGAFGPFDGQLFVGDQGHSNIMRADLEKVDGKWQGACFQFREGFASGVFRLEWGLDGSLFVGQTNRGWASKGTKPFALQRLVWTGETPFEMKHLRAKPDGFEITFTLPVDPESLKTQETWELTSFTYKYHEEYGSPVINKEVLPIRGVVISEDSLHVRLVVDERKLKPGYIHELKAEGVRSAKGLPILHPTGYYTLNAIPQTDRADHALMIPFSQPEHAHNPTSPEGGQRSQQRGRPAPPPSPKRLTVQPSAWNKGPDQIVTIGTRAGLMYDISEIRVKAGSRVQLNFHNNDDMLHNFVLTEPGAANTVGEAALTLGLKGSEMHYVPEMKEVLFHSNMLQPESSETIFFTAPTKPGVYPYLCTFPGHHVQMQGRMVVVR